MSQRRTTGTRATGARTTSARTTGTRTTGTRATGARTTGARTTGARGEARTGNVPSHPSLDPYFACLIFAGVGLGTLGLGVAPRLIVLWTVLLGLWLSYREGQRVQLHYRFADIGRGMVIGTVVSLPVLIAAGRALVTAVPILYVGANATGSGVQMSGAAAFASLVLIAPLAEELFFRQVLQRERGVWIATAIYAAGGLVFFLPTAGRFFAVLLVVCGANALLGAMYGLLYDRYGLATTLATHATVNLTLLFVPAVLNSLGFLLNAP